MSTEEEDVDVSNEATSDETYLNPSAEARDETGDEFSPFDEVADDFKPSSIMKVTGPDGLPTNSFPTVNTDIPPLSIETLVCMEDLSSFVRRDNLGKIKDTYAREKVIRTPLGQYFVVDDRGDLQTQVIPIRPRCKHYIRQMAMFDHNPDGKVHLRLCSARRTTEGTFMTVRDSAMWACSMREPRDLATEEEHLDAFDTTKIEQGKNREHFSIFKKDPS